MAEHLAQLFTDLKARDGADHVLLASLEQAFRDLRGELRVLNSAFECYKAEATKKEKFLLEQVKGTVEGKVASLTERHDALAEMLKLTLEAMTTLETRLNADEV